MRRLTVLALVVIVLESLTFALFYTGSEEQPPCRACEHSELEPSAVSVCEIAQDLHNFTNTRLSLDGQFRSDAGQLSIEASGCTIHQSHDRGSGRRILERRASQGRPLMNAAGRDIQIGTSRGECGLATPGWSLYLNEIVTRD